MHYHISALAANSRIVTAMQEHLFAVGVRWEQVQQDAGDRQAGRGPEILVTVQTDSHDRVASIQEALANAGGTAVSCIEESAAHDAI